MKPIPRMVRLARGLAVASVGIAGCGTAAQESDPCSASVEHLQHCFPDEQLDAAQCDPDSAETLLDYSCEELVELAEDGDAKADSNWVCRLFGNCPSESTDECGSWIDRDYGHRTGLTSCEGQAVYNGKLHRYSVARARGSDHVPSCSVAPPYHWVAHVWIDGVDMGRQRLSLDTQPRYSALDMYSTPDRRIEFGLGGSLSNGHVRLGQPNRAVLFHSYIVTGDLAHGPWVDLRCE